MKLLAKVDAIGLKRIAPWAALLLVLVLVLPMVSFLQNRFGQSERPVVEVAWEEPFSAGEVYSVTELFRLGLGGGTSEIAASRGEPAFEALLPAGDGYWLVDHPSGTAGSRVRRLNGKGEVVASFNTEVGSTLFTPAPDGTLWFDVSAGGEKTEQFVHVDSEGREIYRVSLPAGIFARNVCLDGKGAVYAQAEEWMLDPEQQTAVYSSHLVPVVDRDGIPVDKPIEKALEGSFFGPSGLRYQLTGQAPSDDPEYPAFSVVARDASSTVVATYRLPRGVKPFAADAHGRLYAESKPPVQPQTPGVSTLGDAADEASLLRVFDAEGESACLPVAWPVAVNTWYPGGIPTPDGAIISWKWGAGELIATEARRAGRKADSAAEKPEASQARILITTGMPYSGDPYLAEDAAQRDLWQLVYQGLVSHDASLAAVPTLAESVPTPGAGVSQDGLVIEWKIASGRTWHDGEPVTAGDVVATWEYLRSPSTIDRPEPFPGFDLIESVEAVGDTVRVTLAEPFGPAPAAFFPYVLPAHIVEPAAGTANGGLFSKPIGSGPYRLVRWERDRRWLLALASEGGTEGVRRLEVDFIAPDSAADDYMASAVPTLWTWLAPAEATVVRRDAIGEVSVAPTGRWWGTLADTVKAPLDDQVVRESVMSVHPLSEIRDLYQVDAEYTAGAAPFASAVGDSAAAGRQQSADTAVRMLAGRGWKREAGLLTGPDGKQMLLRYEQTVRQLGKDEVLAEQVDSVLAAWRALGIDARWNYSRPYYYSPVLAHGYLSRAQYDVATGVFPGFLDPAWGSLFDPADTPSYTNPRGSSVTFTEDEVLAALHAQARASYDPDQRRSLGRSVRARAEELSLVVFERPEERECAVLSISGYQPGPYPAGDFWNAGRWTLDEAR